MIVTTLAVALFAKPPSIRLRYRPAVGSVFRHEVSQKSDLSKLGHQNLSYVTHTTILSSGKDGYSAIQKVESMDLGEKFPSSQSLSYRQDMLNRPVKLTIDAFGRIRILSGESKSTVTSALGAVGLVYPDRPITVGDTWTQELSIANLVGDSIPKNGTQSSGNMKILFMVASITDHQVTLTVSGSGKMSLSSNSNGPATRDQVSFNASLLVTGRYLVNRNTGVLDSSRVEKRIVLKTDGKTMPLTQVFEARRI